MKCQRHGILENFNLNSFDYFALSLSNLVVSEDVSYCLRIRRLSTLKTEY